MKKIVPMAGVFLCLMFMIVATPYAQGPRVGIELQQVISPGLVTWGTVLLMFPIGSLNIGPLIASSSLSSFAKHLYVGISAHTSTPLLQLKTVDVHVSTAVSFSPFYGISSALFGIGVMVCWSPSPFLVFQAGISPTMALDGAYVIPLYPHINVLVSWPLF